MNLVANTSQTDSKLIIRRRICLPGALPIHKDRKPSRRECQRTNLKSRASIFFFVTRCWLSHSRPARPLREAPLLPAFAFLSSESSSSSSSPSRDQHSAAQSATWYPAESQTLSQGEKRTSTTFTFSYTCTRALGSNTSSARWKLILSPSVVTRPALATAHTPRGASLVVFWRLYPILSSLSFFVVDRNTTKRELVPRAQNAMVVRMHAKHVGRTTRDVTDKSSNGQVSLSFELTSALLLLLLGLEAPASTAASRAAFFLLLMQRREQLNENIVKGNSRWARHIIKR